MNTTTRRILAASSALATLTLIVASSDAGTGLGLGSWRLSPYLELGGTYDSNVYKTRDAEVSDVYAEPELGLRFSSSTETNRLTLGGNLFYSRREYASESDLSFNTYGDNVGLRYGEQQRSFAELVQSFRRVRDNDRHASDIETSGLSASMVQDIHTLSAQRDVHQLGATAEQRLTDKTDLTVGYRYASSAYDEEGFFDLDGHLGQADLAYLLTDKTAAFVSFRYGVQSQEESSGTADLATVRLGLQARGTEKVTCKIGIGMERYERPLDTGDETTDSFNFDVSADWYVTEKVTLRCGGYNGTQLSSFYRGNGLDFISGWVGGGYRWRPSTTFSVRGVYRVDDYLDPVAYEESTIDREDTRFEAHARIDYTLPSDLLKVYFELSHDLVDSNVEPVDYVDSRVMVGADIRY